MKKLSTSSNKGEFRMQSYLLRKIEEGHDVNSPDVQAMVDLMKQDTDNKLIREMDPNFQENNLEWDLRTTDWILEKVRDSELYSQNLYAAMCNRRFCRADLFPLLREEYWSCTWRYAGGIIADMRQEGDYIDWYCSGSREIESIKSISASDVEQNRSIVGEGGVTDEIREDLQRLGWIVIGEDSDSNIYINM